MKRLTNALNEIAYGALRAGEGYPVISMSGRALIELSFAIEDDLGGKLYDHCMRHTGFMYNGIEFKPDSLPFALSEWYA